MTAGRDALLRECAESCTSGCHADDCEHHGHIPAARPDEPPATGEARKARNEARGRGEDASGGYREIAGCKCEECVRFRTPDAPADGDGLLDVAWAAAEAALPEGWSFWEMGEYAPDPGQSRRVSVRVRLANTIDSHGMTPEVSASGPTPAAALFALSLRLTPSVPTDREPGDG